MDRLHTGMCSSTKSIAGQRAQAIIFWKRDMEKSGTGIGRQASKKRRKKKKKTSKFDSHFYSEKKCSSKMVASNKFSLSSIFLLSNFSPSANDCWVEGTKEGYGGEQEGEKDANRRVSLLSFRRVIAGFVGFSLASFATFLLSCSLSLKHD